MNLIDTHCHLGSSSFKSELPGIVKRALGAGVQKMIAIGCSLPEAKRSIELTEKYPEIFTAIGLHPADLKKNWREDFTLLSSWMTKAKIVAIGETGLDFYRPENAPREWQIESFEQHLALGQETGKPLVIHTRAATKDTLHILQTSGCRNFVLHCFSESVETAEEVFALGGLISFTGIVTFPNAQKIQEVAKIAPLEKIMVETDAPFLAPVPHRGKQNEPAFVRQTAEFIAALRNISFEEFAEVTTSNAVRFFGI